MATFPATGAPVVVVGGGLAGMAAAARLAKQGLPVTLLEATGALGGAWAPRPAADPADPADDDRMDPAPAVVGFPAPWRDLFRKSGRPLEAELDRLGAALEPAAPVRYRFADGSELVLPTDRGDQYEVMSAAYGPAAAARWRALLDELDRVWQAVRPLGLESELRSRDQLTAVRPVLRPRRTVAQLAAELREPHLAALVASTAYRLGSVPARTPAWCAVELSVQRTFGRWTIRSADPTRTGAGTVLVQALAARLALRRVTVVLDRRVTGVTADGGRVTAVLTADGDTLPAAAVVCTADPWQTYGDLWPGPRSRAQRRALRRWQPALAPAVRSSHTDAESADVKETVALTEGGIPTVTYTRPQARGSLQTVHDYTRATPDRSAGIAWNGYRSWLQRPPVTTDVAGLFLAGGFSRGGNLPSSVVLSGALASYACHDLLAAG